MDLAVLSRQEAYGSMFSLLILQGSLKRLSVFQERVDKCYHMASPGHQGLLLSHCASYQLSLHVLSKARAMSETKLCSRHQFSWHSISIGG